jgi:hypothetical protein
MSSMSKNRGRALALLLVVCLTPLPALGDLTNKEKRERPIVATSMPFIAGKLVTRGSQPVLVNGNIVGAGTTILSGANVQTFNSGRVTINLGTLGSLELAPYTVATVDFGDGNVTGTLKRGCATLNANPNVKGTLLTLDGTTPRAASTDGIKTTTVDLCSATAPALPNDAASSVAAANGYNNRFNDPGPFSFGPAGTLALVGASTYFAGGGTLGRAINADGSGIRSLGKGGIQIINNINGGGCCCCCCGQNPSPSSPGC